MTECRHREGDCPRGHIYCMQAVYWCLKCKNVFHNLWYFYRWAPGERQSKSKGKHGIGSDTTSQLPSCWCLSGDDLRSAQNSICLWDLAFYIESHLLIAVVDRHAFFPDWIFNNNTFIIMKTILGWHLTWKHYIESDTVLVLYMHTLN